jgi:magnesium transporter
MGAAQWDLRGSMSKVPPSAAMPVPGWQTRLNVSRVCASRSTGTPSRQASSGTVCATTGTVAPANSSATRAAVRWSKTSNARHGRCPFGNPESIETPSTADTLCRMARTRLYRNGLVELEGFPVADVSNYLEDPSATIWLDFCAPTESDLVAISEELGLHELAVEDAVHEHQRPKLDRYDSHSFLTAYAVHLDDTTGALATSELAAFITDRALVTVRKADDFDMDAVLHRWDSSAELAKSGVGFLVHGLLDYIVDGHFHAAQSLDEQIEALEDLVFDDQPDHHDVQRRSLRLRKSLVQLRRVVLPMREVVNSLMRRDLHLVDEAITPYFQDIYDHVLRASEWTESLRDLITTIRETQLNIQGYRLNTIMKKVTSWAAIIAVPTAVTGFYGQNVPYPGFQTEAGFWASTIGIIVLSAALYVLFKRRDWL